MKRANKLKRTNSRRKSPRPHNDRKQNLSGRKKVGSQQNGGRIHELETDRENDLYTDAGINPPFPSADPPSVLTPVEAALNNWKTRQSMTPWWWLSYARNERSVGVVIVEGWNFLDALNNANKRKLSPLKAAVHGDELGDLWAPREGGRERWINRLLTKAEAKEVFGELIEVTEQGLYSPGKRDEVKFK